MQEHSAGSSLELLSAPRQVLLEALKNNGEATTEQIARDTYLSAGAVRMHLLALEAKGLVSFVRVREGPGRPRHVFRLTDAGESIFPQLYAPLANIVLAAVEEEEPAVVERIFGRLLAAQLGRAQAVVHAADPSARLGELTGLVDEYGFYPQLEVFEGQPARLTLRHCPLQHVVGEHPRICDVECDALKGVLPGARVERTAHRLDGDELCTYEIEVGA